MKGNTYRTRKLLNTVDSVNHPIHYNRHPSGVECIDIIEHMTLNLGNAVKYIWRAGLKAANIDNYDQLKIVTIEDLQKAKWYIDREIKRLSKCQND